MEGLLVRLSLPPPALEADLLGKPPDPGDFDNPGSAAKVEIWS
jgi:hypothetical protein